MTSTTATVAASMQGSLRHMPGRSAQCSLSLHFSQTLIQYSAISGTFLMSTKAVFVRVFYCFRNCTTKVFSPSALILCITLVDSSGGTLV